MVLAGNQREYIILNLSDYILLSNDLLDVEQNNYLTEL